MMGGRLSRRTLLLLLLAGAIVVLGLVVIAGAGFLPAETGVAGTVVDERTGLPVPGATVAAHDTAVETDDQGRYAFQRLPVGTEIEVTKPGFEPSRTQVGPSGDLDVRLSPRVVGGTVRDAADGKPIAGAQVRVGDLKATADAEGRFELLYVPADAPLTAEAPGYEVTSRPQPGDRADVRLEPQVLQLEVLATEQGEPIAGARVEAGGQVAESDESGRVRLLRLREGEQITVEADGFQGTALSYRGQTAQRIVLRARPLRGTITDAESGEPLPRVIVTDGHSKTVTDDKGHYELSGVRQDDQLVASADGYEQTEADIDDHAEIDIAMKPLPRGSRGAEADQLPPGTVREVFVDEAKFPAAMAFAPDGRLFYNELRTGRIRVVQDGVLLEEPFYDFTVAGQPETGLLGIAFDPNFAENRHVYAFYTEAKDRKRDGDTNGPNRVVRLTDRDGTGVDPVEILELPSGYIHNAGNIHFGPDGKLYISLGNTDKDGLSQDLSSPAGKILRVNPDGTAPEDNPFAGDPDKYGGVYAYGLRNSYDFAFHPETGRLFATENGPGDNDEINLIGAGENYGWPASGPQNKPGLADPILTFDKMIAPSGTEFYGGNAIESWRNDLFYCSYHGGELRRIVLSPPGYDGVLADQFIAADCRLDVLTGPDGALYFSDVDAIYRIRPEGVAGLPAPAAEAEATPTATPRGSTRSTPTPQPRAQPGAGGPVHEVEVLLDEWSIKVTPAQVKAGRVRFVVKNVGNTVHSLGVVGNGVDARTEDYPGGETRVLEVTLAPGIYELNCPVGGHTELGMHTEFTVR